MEKERCSKNFSSVLHRHPIVHMSYNNTHKVASGSQFAFGRQHGPKKSPHHEPKGALWQTSVVRHSYLLSSAALIPFSTYCRAAANRSRQQEAIAHRETLLAML